MARTNIEECWWTDPRRSLLISKVGDEYLADAVAVRAWRTAQEFWKHNQRRIPKDIFDTLRHAQSLIDAKLAIVEGEFVYVRGSSAYLDWVREQRDQAREAGKKSAEVRKQKNGTAQPPRKNSTKSKQTPERTSNDSRTKSNDAEPSVSVSDSYSVSVSSSESGKGDEVLAKTKTPQGVSDVIAFYKVKFKERYNAEAIIRGKESGILKQFVKDVGSEKAKELIDAYLKMPNPWFITKRHDVVTLTQNLNAVSQFLESGRIITQKEIRQLDEIVNDHNIRQMIDRGEI